jgi:hypothetical protein
VAVTGPGTEADIAPVVAGIVVADMAAAIAAEAAVATVAERIRANSAQREAFRIVAPSAVAR